MCVANWLLCVVCCLPVACSFAVNCLLCFCWGVLLFLVWCVLSAVACSLLFVVCGVLVVSCCLVFVRLLACVASVLLMSVLCACLSGVC